MTLKESETIKKKSVDHHRHSRGLRVAKIWKDTRVSEPETCASPDSPESPLKQDHQSLDTHI